MDFSVIEEQILKHIFAISIASRQASLTGLGLRKTLGAKSRWKNRQNPRDPNDQCLAETFSGSLSSYRGHEQHQCWSNALFSTTKPNSIDFVATKNFMNNIRAHFLFVLKVNPGYPISHTGKYSRDRSTRWFCNLWENLRGFHAPVMDLSRKSNKDKNKKYHHTWRKNREKNVPW